MRPRLNFANDTELQTIPLDIPQPAPKIYEKARAPAKRRWFRRQGVLVGVALLATLLTAAVITILVIVSMEGHLGYASPPETAENATNSSVQRRFAGRSMRFPKLNMTEPHAPFGGLRHHGVGRQNVTVAGVGHANHTAHRVHCEGARNRTEHDHHRYHSKNGTVHQHRHNDTKAHEHDSAIESVVNSVIATPGPAIIGGYKGRLPPQPTVE